MPYDPFAYQDPVQMVLERQRRLREQQQQQQQAQTADMPEEDSSAIGRLMEGSLGGLAYVGKVLDKTFGGRAVRGLLSGNLREGMSVLPLSDTLGITREEDTVHGTDLLRNAGLIDPGDHGWESDVAGFGAEVALDPSMWVGAAVPKGLAALGQGVGRRVGAGIQAVSGANPYTYAARKLDDVYQAAKVPVRTLFDTRVHGATGRAGQGVAEDVFDPTLKALQGQAQMETAAARNAAGDVYQAAAAKSPVDENRVYQGILRQSQGFDAAARDDLLAAGLDPASADKILGITTDFAKGTRATSGPERTTGVVSKEWDDSPQWVLDANKPVREAHAAAELAVVQADVAHRASIGGPDAAARLADLRAAEAARDLAKATPIPHPGDLPFLGYQPAEYSPANLVPFDDAAGLTRRRNERLSGVGPNQTTVQDEFRGIPGGRATINEWATDPRLSTSKATFSEQQATNHVLEQITGRPASPASPAYKTAETLAKRLRALPPQALDKGFFSADVFGAGLGRRMETARTVASGETVIEGVNRFAAPVADLEAAGQRYVRVPDLLREMGLTHVDDAGLPVAQDRVLGLLAPKHGLARTGAASEFKQLEGMAVPADVADDMRRIGQAWRTPESLAPVVDFWDRTVSMFKTYLTKVFPAFHARNLMSGSFNMWRDGALSAGAGQDMLSVIRGGQLSDAAAKKLYPGLPLDQATRAFRDELMGSRVAFSRSGQTAERVGPGVDSAFAGEPLLSEVPQVGAAAPRSIGQDLKNFAGGLVPEAGKVGEGLNPLLVGIDGPANTLVTQADKLGNTLEDWVRGTHYLAKRMQGADEAAAKLSVMKYQINYEELTQFEKHVMKRLFPWYGFSRGNLPPLLEDLANKPGKVATATRAITGMREQGDFVPPWVAEGASIPIAGAPDGEKRFISSFGLPMEDEAVKALGSAAKGDYQRVLQQVFGMSQPFVKLPAELATDTQMYSGRKLEDLRPYEFLQGLPEDQARQLTQVIANTPASRAASTLNRAIDERKGFGPTATNLLSGATVTDVDTERVRDVAAKKALENLLAGKPGVRSREEVYVKPESLGQLTPEQLQEYTLLREIERRQRKRAAERKHAGG